jgi:hypothetical protein
MPCGPDSHCEERTVADGVTARIENPVDVEESVASNLLEIQRPNEIVDLVETGTPGLLLDNGDLFALATAIGEDTDAATAPVTPTQRLRAALTGVLPDGVAIETVRYPKTLHPWDPTGPVFPVSVESQIADQAGTTTVGTSGYRSTDYTFPECPADATHCEERTLPNGNTAWLTAGFVVPGEPGLLTQVTVKTENDVLFVSERNLDGDGNVSRPELMLDTEQMFALATALS